VAAVARPEPRAQPRSQPSFGRNLAPERGQLNSSGRPFLQEGSALGRAGSPRRCPTLRNVLFCHGHYSRAFPRPRGKVSANAALRTRIQPGNGAAASPDTLFANYGVSIHPLRVLVVDDDEMSRRSAGRASGGRGYAVQSAESGEAALVLLSQGEPPPDLVLADVQLPGISGSLLAGELRRACGPTTSCWPSAGANRPATPSPLDGFC